MLSSLKLMEMTLIGKNKSTLSQSLFQLDFLALCQPIQMNWWYQSSKVRGQELQEQPRDSISLTSGSKELHFSLNGFYQTKLLFVSLFPRRCPTLLNDPSTTQCSHLLHLHKGLTCPHSHSTRQEVRLESKHWCAVLGDGDRPGSYKSQHLPCLEGDF